MRIYRRQSIFLFSVILALGAFFFLSYQNRIDTVRAFEETEAAMKESEWLFVWGKIEGFRAQASDQAKSIAYKIRRDIVEEYQHNDRSLRADLGNLDTDNHPVVNAFAKNLAGVYLNGVQSDGDDAFVATPKGIASDLSPDCSAEGRSRSYEKEIKLHYNQTLAKAAIGELKLQSKDLIGWQFSTPSDPRYTTDAFTEENLRSLYMAYGLQSLESLEFLSAAYIDDRKDLIGMPVIDNRGIRQPNNQFIVVQGFNPVRQLRASPDGSTTLTVMQAEVSAVKSRLEWVVAVYDILLVVTLVLMAFVYVVGTILIDRVRAGHCED